jgi:hypothetical protein
VAAGRGDFESALGVCLAFNIVEIRIRLMLCARFVGAQQ